jgi:hypothetical protein
MKFILADTNRYYLPGQTRFLHVATVHYDVREFLCMIDSLTQKTYLEEVTGGHLETIDDDGLFSGLHEFLFNKGLLSMARPALPDDVWLKRKV